MTAWLSSLLERLPPSVRRVAVVAMALLLLGAVAATVIIAPPSEVARRSQRQPARPTSSSTPASAGRKRSHSPVTAGQLLKARGVADRFLKSYLPFVYGRARAGSVSGVTLALRRALLRERAQVTPAELRRHPRVISLQVVGTTAEVVLATATVEDSGITTYALRFTLEHRAGAWVVSGADGG
jgi:hypothetical protein